MRKWEKGLELATSMSGALAASGAVLLARAMLNVRGISDFDLWELLVGVCTGSILLITFTFSILRTSGSLQKTASQLIRVVLMIVLIGFWGGSLGFAAHSLRSLLPSLDVWHTVLDRIMVLAATIGLLTPMVALLIHKELGRLFDRMIDKSNNDRNKLTTR